MTRRPVIDHEAPHTRGASSFCGVRIKPIYKFPPGTRIRTPSGRLARVMFYDEENRIHVRYIGSDKLNANEQGLFPGSLLNQFNRVPEDDDTYPPASTDIQETCGKGNIYAEVQRFWAERAGRVR